MSLVARSRVSEAEFLSLPESTDRIELLDGEVIVSPTPTFWHQEVLSRVVVVLRQWAQPYAASVTVAQAPLDVRFAPGRILQPDAMVFLTRLSMDTVGPIERVPEICIEVLSANRAYDRVTKRFVYGAAGVQELWLADPAGFIERWAGQGLAADELLDGTLSTPLLPGFALQVRSLFE